LKILITGCAGFIGSLLTKELSQSHKVVGIDSFEYCQEDLIGSALRGATIFHQDLILKPLSRNFLKDFDVIFHMAAIVGAPACDRSPQRATEINFGVTKDIVDKLDGHQLLVFPDTNSGYGSCPVGICTEETPLKSISLYGKTKEESEKYILDKYPNSIIFRLATLFGTSPRTRVDLLVNSMTMEGYFNKEIKVFDPHLRRNFVHVKDVVRCMIKAMTNKNMIGQVYNLGLDAANMTKGELAGMIIAVLNRQGGGKPIPPYILGEGHDPDLRDYIVSSAKLMKTGWQPIYDLEEGIEEIIEFCKGLPKDIDDRNEILKMHKNV